MCIANQGDEPQLDFNLLIKLHMHLTSVVFFFLSICSFRFGSHWFFDNIRSETCQTIKDDGQFEFNSFASFIIDPSKDLKQTTCWRWCGVRQARPKCWNAIRNNWNLTSFCYIAIFWCFHSTQVQARQYRHWCGKLLISFFQSFEEMEWSLAQHA